MKPHKHCELIKAWADGTEIEYLQSNAFEHNWILLTDPSFFNHKNTHFRIKPEPKPDLIKTMHIWFDMDFSEVTIADNTDVPNLQLIFDSKTGDLKSAEVLK